MKMNMNLKTLAGGAIVVLFSTSSAFAAPTISSCSGTNPWSSSASCLNSEAKPICTFADSELRCNFQPDVNCDDGVTEGGAADAYIVNESSNDHFIMYGECSEASGTITYCCDIDDSSDEIDTVALRGTDNDDVLAFQYSSGTYELTKVNVSLLGKIEGEGGDDTITGSTADIGTANYIDVLSGGAGADTMYGDQGRDTIYGNGGADVIDGGPDLDTLYGNGGADKIDGDEGNDVIDGGDGDDIIIGANGVDTIYGRDGADRICGDEGSTSSGVLTCETDETNFDGGRDTIDGGPGDDFIQGGADNDTIYGRGGDDKLAGGLGADTIYGGIDDDEICDASGGLDKLWGGNNDASTDGHDILFDSDFSDNSAESIDGEAGSNECNPGPDSSYTYAFNCAAYSPSTCPFSVTAQ